MRNMILFLALAVSAGCATSAKELTLNEIETEAQNICNKRLVEGTTDSFVPCYKIELEAMIEEQSYDCEREAELRQLIFYTCLDSDK